MSKNRRTVTGRNRLDFVPPGSIAGQISEISYGLFSEYEMLRDGDGPDWTPVEYSVPGMDTQVSLWGHPFLYRVRAIQTADGPRVTELNIDSPDHDVAITPDDLRNLAKLLDRLAYVGTNPADPSTKAFHQPEKPPPKRPGRYGNPDHYVRVAEFARIAHRQRAETGVSVRKAIAQKWMVSEHTADKWLARARKANLLQAGELGGKPSRISE
ncbi:hypothetical protein BH11ACT6_BH11ACT6_53370 [soil metagenome]